MKALFKLKTISLTIVGLLFIVGIGFFGLNWYKNYQQKSEEEKLAQEKQLETKQNEQNSEIEKLRQELEALKNKELQDTKRTIVLPSLKDADNLTSIIKQWRPRVAFVDCKIVLNGNNVGEQSGSGYVLGIDIQSGHALLLTNYHVIDVIINDLYGKPTGFTAMPTSCDIRIPNDQFVTVYQDGNESPFLGSKEQDFAIIDIKNPTAYMRNVIENNGGPTCNKKAELGEKIVILGWPGIGDQNDVTVTDGIISGYDGNYYITSAKVEHGNSGGIAISLKNNCYLGIPTFVAKGEIESLARILDIKAIFPPSR
jgi:hypothetical protein